MTSLATAQADTQTCPPALRAHLKSAVDDGVELSPAMKSFDAAPFVRLLNAAVQLPGNAGRTCLQMERE